MSPLSSTDSKSVSSDNQSVDAVDDKGLLRPGRERQRIVKNTLMLYVRMLVVMFVGLYTSRIILKELGTQDYGIYNLVGGIVTMFAFLNTTMTGATSRFLTYDCGLQDRARLRATFSAALTLHVVIAGFIVVLAETVGLWFVNSQLVIPVDRMTSANIVYQLSLLTTVIYTLQVPFNALTISMERMDVYALVEIAKALFNLFFLSIMQYIPGEKLLVYAGLLLFNSVWITSVYTIYTLRKFTAASLQLSRDWQKMKPMLLFSTLDLYGNLSVSAKTQGINVLLNIFFGTLLNAANAIATQLQAAILMFSTNVSMAFRPQVIKRYAQGMIREMQEILEYSTMLSQVLFSLVAIPVLLDTKFVLELWLVTPPPYTVTLSQIAIITCWFEFIYSQLIIPLHATGDIRRISFIGGSIYLLPLPVVYILLKIWPIPEIAYLVSLFFMIISTSYSCIAIRRQIPDFSMTHFWIQKLLPTSATILLSAIVPYLMKSYLPQGFWRLLLIGGSYLLTLIPSFYFIALRQAERDQLNQVIQHKLLAIISRRR